MPRPRGISKQTHTHTNRVSAQKDRVVSKESTNASHNDRDNESDIHAQYIKGHDCKASVLNTTDPSLSTAQRDMQTCFHSHSLEVALKSLVETFRVASAQRGKLVTRQHGGAERAPALDGEGESGLGAVWASVVTIMCTSTIVG